jgi:hypothetical protein
MEKRKVPYVAPAAEAVDIQASERLCQGSPLLIMMVDQPATPGADQAGFGDNWSWE